MLSLLVRHSSSSKASSSNSYHQLSELREGSHDVAAETFKAAVPGIVVEARDGLAQNMIKGLSNQLKRKRKYQHHRSSIGNGLSKFPVMCYTF